MDQKIVTALASLQARVEADHNITTSAVTLLNGLSAQIFALKSAGNPEEVAAAIEDLAAQVQANADALAQAVSANTQP